MKNSFRHRGNRHGFSRHQSHMVLTALGYRLTQNRHNGKSKRRRITERWLQLSIRWNFGKTYAIASSIQIVVQFLGQNRHLEPVDAIPFSRHENFSNNLDEILLCTVFPMSRGSLVIDEWVYLAQRRDTSINSSSIFTTFITSSTCIQSLVSSQSSLSLWSLSPNTMCSEHRFTIKSSPSNDEP